MNTKDQLPAYQELTIKSVSGHSQMTFLPQRGGIARSLIMRGQERLFLHDFFEQANWHDLPGGWPFLFPICARQALDGEAGVYQYNDTHYQLPIHGFGWWQEWQVIAHSEDQLSLLLADNSSTRELYPFEFNVQLDYKITDSQLTCQQSYRNLGNKPMPYTSGFHPYFKTPWPPSEKTKVQLQYQPQQNLIYNEQLTAIITSKEAFSMPRSITDPIINEQLTTLGHDHRAQLIYPNHERLSIEVRGDHDNSDMFSYMQLYTMQDKAFFCLEPWNGQPNALNSGQGLRLLAPGASETATLCLRVDVDI